MEQNKIYITAAGLKKIKQDLDHLINVERKNIARRIQEAKELGDLSENAEYSSAKEDQAFLEMKISELEETIRNAEIIKPQRNPDGIVQIGSTVKFKDEAGEIKSYTIVGSQEADPASGRISNESPIGRAFLSKRQGETVEFKSPRGKVKYMILAVE